MAHFAVTSLSTLFSEEHPEFITVTCLNWQPVLQDNLFKDIILESLNFLVGEKRVTVYAFAIMSNHFHLIWQMTGDHTRDKVQRDFLKFTSQQILKHLKEEQSSLLVNLAVNAKDRKYQVWERNSLGIPLWSSAALYQKLDYIHNNPVKAGLCKYAEEYKYSSAKFYLMGKNAWQFLAHVDG
jgi:putative transposase